MGAIVCFLFVLGIILVKGPYKWALVVATAFSIALAWGSNFMPLTALFFKVFPLYNKFRTVSSILIVAEITMPLLGFLALRDIMGQRANGPTSQEIKKKTGRAVLIAAGITGGICLILALFGGSLFNFRSSYDASWSAGLPDFVYQGRGSNPLRTTYESNPYNAWVRWVQAYFFFSWAAAWVNADSRLLA